MVLYIVRTDYLNNGFYGVYSSMKRAQLAMEYFLEEDENIVAIEPSDPYAFTFTTAAGEQFGVEIVYDELDFEFVEGMIKENN